MPRAGCRPALAAAAALALLAAVPAPAQPEPGAGMPADSQLPNPDAQLLFEALEGGEVTEEMLDAMATGLGEVMDAAVAHMMTRGERVEDWQDRGIDLQEIVAGRPGGLAGNMTEETVEFGVQRVYFADPPLESLLPPELIAVGRYGAQVEGPGVRLEILHLSPRLVVAMRSQYRRQGRADCLERLETRLYSDPAISATEADAIAFFVTRNLAGRMDALGVCFVKVEAEPGAYAEQVFDRDGYRLPNLEDAGSRRRIVPAAPFPRAAPRAPIATLQR